MGGGGPAEQSNNVVLISATEFDRVPATATSKMLALASISAPLMNIDDKRTPVDIVCVIDRSGSMAGAKMELTKKTLDFLVSQLDSRDQMAIVMFDSNVETVMPMVQMSNKEKDRARGIIGGLQATSSTNLSGGLLEGISLVRARSTKNMVCSVLLFTDGAANVGIRNPQQLTDVLQRSLAGLPDPCTVFTFGFGQDHDASLLRSLAETGHGMYYFVESAEQIPLSFADCLGGLQSVVAQNVRLKVTAIEDARVTRQLSRFKVTGVTEFPTTSLTLELGDLYSEEQRDLLFEFELPALGGPLERFSFAVFELSYFNLLTAAPHTVACEVFVRRTVAEEAAAAARDERVEMHAIRVRTADAMEESRRLVEQNKHTQARELLQTTRDAVVRSSAAQTPLAQQMAAELTDLANREDLRAEVRAMSSRAMQHAYQRAANEAEGQTLYTTSAKASKKAFFR